MAENDNIKCPLCGTGILEDKIIDYRTTLKEGEHYKPILVRQLAVEICSNCQEVILPTESMERVQAERHMMRQLITPDELKSLRNSIGLTQSKMSELLGVGKKSYLRWENGSCLQSKSMDRYIRLLAANPENINFLKKLAEPGK